MIAVPQAITLQAPGLARRGEIDVRTIRTDCVTMVTEEYDYSKVGCERKKRTFVYTASTCFEVKETRAQVLKLLGWDLVKEVKQHEKT